MSEVLAQGKTKSILATGNEGIVLVRSFDDITAGDGKVKASFEGKAVLATTTTCNIFSLLQEAGVRTHFLGQVDSTTFRARRAEMIPLEVVIRRIATGSHLKRNPGEVEDGHIFNKLVTEFFYKDDERGDPYVLADGEGSFALYVPSQPINDTGYLGELDVRAGSPLGRADLDTMANMATEVFEVLERALRKLGVVIWDLKIEFGLIPDGDDGYQLVVADVIDADSWRVKDEEGNPLSKQVFRDAIFDGEISEADLAKVSEVYQIVAGLSGRLALQA